MLNDLGVLGAQMVFPGYEINVRYIMVDCFKGPFTNATLTVYRTKYVSTSHKFGIIGLV